LTASRSGSSPHTWGTLMLDAKDFFRLRFIPTHVGNTAIGFGPIGLETVHPHTRGEHKGRATADWICHGSSPHTWGTRIDCPGTLYVVRFIPTHVGNTLSPLQRSLKASVHPHTRGEHTMIQDLNQSYSGSSPHTWGTPIVKGECSAECRFIPTHVGNTQKR